MLQEEIKKALIKQPNWVSERAIQNASKYVEGKLISKYESKDIQELKEEDIIKPQKAGQSQYCPFTWLLRQ